MVSMKTTTSFIVKLMNSFVDCFFFWWLAIAVSIMRSKQNAFVAVTNALLICFEMNKNKTKFIYVAVSLASIILTI